MKESPEIENLKKIYRQKKKTILKELDVDYLRERQYILDNEIRKKFNDKVYGVEQEEHDRHLSDDTPILDIATKMAAMTACM